MPVGGLLPDWETGSDGFDEGLVGFFRKVPERGKTQIAGLFDGEKKKSHGGRDVLVCIDFPLAAPGEFEASIKRIEKINGPLIPIRALRSYDVAK